MTVMIEPGLLAGAVTPPPSKSQAHRLIIAAALAVVLAVGAGASGVLRSAAEVLGPIFGASSAQTEIIDKIGYPGLWDVTAAGSALAGENSAYI